MDNLKSRMPQKVMCIRDGTWQRIDSVELVPGDIVRVSADEKIPADLILFDCQDMRVNNSAVTGEFEPLLRNATQNDVNFYESPNVAFLGTECKTGQGTGMVFKVGDNSVLGRMSSQDAGNEVT